MEGEFIIQVDALEHHLNSISSTPNLTCLPQLAEILLKRQIYLR